MKYLFIILTILLSSLAYADISRVTGETIDCATSSGYKLCDDFSDDSINATLWTTTSGCTGPTEANGYISLQGACRTAHWGGATVFEPFIDTHDWTIELNYINTGDDRSLITLGDSINYNVANGVCMVYSDSAVLAGDEANPCSGGGDSITPTIYNINVTTQYYYNSTSNNLTFIHYNDTGGLRQTLTGTTNVNSNLAGAQGLNFNSDGASAILNLYYAIAWNGTPSDAPYILPPAPLEKSTITGESINCSESGYFLCDDFEDDSINSSLWLTSSGCTGPTESGGSLSLTGACRTSVWGGATVYEPFNTSNDWTVEANLNSSSFIFHFSDQTNYNTPVNGICAGFASSSFNLLYEGYEDQCAGSGEDSPVTAKGLNVTLQYYYNSTDNNLTINMYYGSALQWTNKSAAHANLANKLGVDIVPDGAGNVLDLYYVAAWIGTPSDAPYIIPPVNQILTNSSWNVTSQNLDSSSNSTAWNTAGANNINVTSNLLSLTVTTNVNSNMSCRLDTEGNYTQNIAYNSQTKAATTETTSHSITFYENFTVGSHCAYCSFMDTVVNNETAGGVSSSGCLNFTAIDLVAPTWSNNQVNVTNVTRSQSIQINITANDNFNVSHLVFSYLNTTSSTFINESTFFIGRKNITYVYNRTVPADILTLFNYTWYVNDTSGNWNQTDIFYLLLTTNLNLNTSFGTNISKIQFLVQSDNFNPNSYTVTQYNTTSTNQTDTNPLINITNIGDAGTIVINLNQTKSRHAIKCYNSSNRDDAVNITASNTTFNTLLASGKSAIWCWGDYIQATGGFNYKLNIDIQ